MTQTASEVSKAELLEAIESVKTSLEGVAFFDPRFRELYLQCYLKYFYV